MEMSSPHIALPTPPQVANDSLRSRWPQRRSLSKLDEHTVVGSCLNSCSDQDFDWSEERIQKLLFSP